MNKDIEYIYEYLKNLTALLKKSEKEIKNIKENDVVEIAKLQTTIKEIKETIAELKKVDIKSDIADISASLLKRMARYYIKDGYWYFNNEKLIKATGENGKNGLNGKDGINGTNGKDGKDGKHGLNGINGRNGADGKNGKDGLNGKDGVDGKTPIFEVVETETVEAEENADVEVEREDNIYKLKVKIPRGKRGVSGRGQNGKGIAEGGTTGQVLAKASNNDYDTTWVSGGADTTNLVPYTGADKDVDLGNKELSSSRINLQSKGNNIIYAKRTDVFDFVQYKRITGEIWTDITTDCGRSKGTASGDVLDIIGDTFVIGKVDKFNNIYIDVGTARSATGTFVWEYSLGGDVWATLTCTDGTNALLTDGVISFETPEDWVTDSQNGSEQMYFIRLRADTGTFSTEPTVYLVVPNDGSNIIEIYANGSDTNPSIRVNAQGDVRIGETGVVTTFGGAVAMSGTLSGVTTMTTTGALTNSPSATGYIHTPTLNANAPVATALIPNENSPVARFSGQAWNGAVTKINAMDIYVNPNSDPITNARMAFKNTTIDGYADENEVMNISSNGRLNILGTAIHPLNTFDRVFHFLAPSTYTDDTLILKTLGSITGDVLNVVGDYLYIGKRTTFSQMYFEFATIMSAGTTRKWEYSKGGGTWGTFTPTSDATNNWQQNGSVLFDAPVDWETDTVNATPGLYWVRIGTVSGTFTVEPVLRFCFPNTVVKDGQVFSNGEFDTATGWTTTGDWAYSTLDHTFTFSTGSGTLRQAKESFNKPAKPNTWYRFRYYVGVAAPSTTVSWIGEEFSDGKTYFSGSTTEVDVFFKSNSDPQDFVIYTTATATSGFRLDAVSLLEMTQGDLIATGIITANGYKTGTETGQTASIEVVVDVKDTGNYFDTTGRVQKKIQTLTFTNGLLTTVGSVSDWIDVTGVIE